MTRCRLGIKPSHSFGCVQHIPSLLSHVYSALCHNLSWPVSCCLPIKIPLNYITLCLINLMDAPSLIPKGRGRGKGGRREEKNRECKWEPVFSGVWVLERVPLSLDNRSTLNFLFVHTGDLQHLGCSCFASRFRSSTSHAPAQSSAPLDPDSPSTWWAAVFVDMLMSYRQ